jgi:hypothetical protein
MQKILATAAIATAVGIQSANATLGVDVSQRVTNWSCLKKTGFEFAITRGYLSYGAVDSHANANIKDAHAGGIKNIDIYMFPCRAKSA